MFMLSACLSTPVFAGPIGQTDAADGDAGLPGLTHKSELIQLEPLTDLAGAGVFPTGYAPTAHSDFADQFRANYEARQTPEAGSPQAPFANSFVFTPGSFQGQKGGVHPDTTVAQENSMGTENIVVVPLPAAGLLAATGLGLIATRRTRGL